MAAMMALNTNAAGPSLQSFSKMDPIAQSKTGVGPVLRALLIACKSRHVLAVRNLQPQSAAVRLRSEAADSLHDREIVRAGAVRHIPGKPGVAPVCEGYPKACNSRTPPVRVPSLERGPRA